MIQFLLRKNLLNLYNSANCGHIACSLSCIDILYVLFENKLDTERVILSKGHAAGALYVILNYFGEISDDELSTFYQNGTKLSAHPSANSFKNIPFALGSLGHGFPIACGMALAKKNENNKDFVYVLMSDGETNEGTTWEAAHFAVANELSNLIICIDRNRLQGFGKLTDILGDTADKNKWESIGFEVFEIDGHDLISLSECVANCKSLTTNRPKLIIANTVKGKGVDFMENEMEWHYLPMTGDQYKNAMMSIEKNYHA